MKDSSFISCIGRVRQALRREFDARAAPLGITVPLFQVLRRLWETDGLPGSVLAREVCVSPASITHVVDSLEQSGLVRRDRSTEDRRTIRIYLTPSGEALQGPLMEIYVAVSDQALEGLAPEQRAALISGLQQAIRNLEPATEAGLAALGRRRACGFGPAGDLRDSEERE